ncbi:MAG: GEVED domain-containing protein [Pseudomonadota bacterium]
MMMAFGDGRSYKTPGSASGSFRAAMALVCLAIANAMAPAAAQQFGASPTGGAINASATCGTADLETYIDITDSITIGDLNVGFRASHTYRTDINLSLESPAGTVVDLLTGTYTSNLDDYDVLFDDDVSGPVVDTGSHGADNTAAPFYDSVVQSEGDLLSEFDGENTAGRWTFRMCDVFPGADDGTLLSADLFVTPLLPTNIDLSLSLSPSSATPTYGDQVTYTVTATNDGPAMATGVTASVSLASGVSYVSDTAGGEFVPSTGVWTVGALASGASTSVQIVATTDVSGGYTTTAEITAANENDIDSTPANASSAPTEDDSASNTLSPQTPPGGTAGTPPSLTCVAGARTWQWSAATWTAGATSGSGTQGGDTVQIDMTGSVDDFIASSGTATPFIRNTASYGETTNPTALYLLADFDTASEEITTTFRFGTAGLGVDAVQFKAFDVDTGTNGSSFVDRFTVTASLGGAAVPVTLTQGSANVVAGASIFGITSATDSQDTATLFITSETPFDTLVVDWGSGPGAQANPSNQGIGFGDFTYCPRTFDFGDASASYGSPSHARTPAYYLGAGQPDTETAAQPTASADGDDNDAGGDDEDGVSFPTLSQGDVATVNVNATGAGGFLQAWIDFDGDGSFGIGEQVAANLQDTDADGTIPVTVSVPAGATTTQTFARFRWSATSSLNATSQAFSGEVEDYTLMIQPSGPPAGTCPAGYQPAFGSGTASSVVATGTDAQNATNALGTPEMPGINGTTANAARIRNADRTLILDLEEVVPGSSNLSVTTARDNGSGAMTVSFSLDGTGFTTAGTFSDGPNDQLRVVTFAVPSGGARYVRFQRDSGNVWIAGMAYSLICEEIALLTATKTFDYYVPTAFAVPGEDVIYTITFTNEGGGAVDADSVELIDELPPDVVFYNGDMDDGGSLTTDPVAWVDNGSGLTLVYADDVAFSDGTSGPPTDFASCTYTPSAGYDPSVTHICFNPSGIMASGDPDPSFAISFRTQIR